MKELVKKLIKNRLHDAVIYKIIYKDNLELYIDCKGMNINYYDKDIDNIKFRIVLSKIFKLSFDFEGLIDIIDFDLNNKKLNVNGNDLIVEFDNYYFDKIEIIKKRRKINKNIDNLLKSNI